MQHRLSQRFHSITITLLQQRDTVDVEQLVISAQALVAGRRTSVDHAFDEDAEVLGAACLALDADAEAGFLRVVDGDVESKDLAVFPGECYGFIGFFIRLR